MPEHNRSCVVVNADDFGLSGPINLGIYQSVRTGIVTSVSLAANGAAFEQAVSMLADMPVSAGWHINLTSGYPVSGHVPSLLKDGRFIGKYGFLRRFWTGRIKPADIKRELEAQYNKLCRAGIDITHADSHHDIHFLPGFAHMAAFLFRSIKILHVRYAGSRLGLLDGVLNPSNSLTYTVHRQLCDKSPFDVPQTRVHVVWGHELLSKGEKLSVLKRYLAAAKDGLNLIICHPSASENKPVENLKYTGGKKELHALCAPSLKNKANFISFLDLVR